ncbi:MAG: hypothetical protein AAF741_17680 [Bacteroidota bacterium]
MEDEEIIDDYLTAPEDIPKSHLDTHNYIVDWWGKRIRLVFLFGLLLVSLAFLTFMVMGSPIAFYCSLLAIGCFFTFVILLGIASFLDQLVWNSLAYDFGNHLRKWLFGGLLFAGGLSFILLCFAINYSGDFPI